MEYRYHLKHYAYVTKIEKQTKHLEALANRSNQISYNNKYNPGVPCPLPLEPKKEVRWDTMSKWPKSCDVTLKEDPWDLSVIVLILKEVDKMNDALLQALLVGLLHLIVGSNGGRLAGCHNSPNAGSAWVSNNFWKLFIMLKQMTLTLTLTITK